MQNVTRIVHILHGHDFAGNRTYRLDAVHAANSELYEYDAINQIKSLDRGVLSANNDSVANSTFTESWYFDKTGNWLEFNKNGATETRTHNKANELQGIATHDANGNMLLMPGLKGKYDAWNRLVEVRSTNDELIASYEYNGLNQRIKKTVGTTVTTSFFNNEWQELESQSEHEASASIFVWGTRYIDDLAYREKGTERLYALQDPNWNVVALTDSAGTVVERMKYDAFGKTTWLDEEFEEKISSEYAWTRTFTGQIQDEETNLMLYRNRYYHPALGRFVHRDPILYASSDMNLYRYVKNSPVFHVDPTGHSGGFPVIPSGCHTPWSDLWYWRSGRTKPLTPMSPPVPPTPPVAPLPPPSEERKKECCEIEEKNRGKGISGGFVCCDGHAIPCAWNIEHFGMNEEQLSVPANVAFIAAVDKCTILHEEQHIEDSFPCKPGKGVERGKLLAGEVHERSECIAYQIQVDCLRKEQSNVDSHFHETLQAMVNEHVKFANTEYNCVNHGLEVK